MNRTLLLFLMLSAFACKKKQLNKVHPEMQGYWKHWVSANEWEQFIINEHGAGKTRYVKDGKDTRGDLSRAWYIRDDYLIWSWRGLKSRGWKINSYPAISDTLFIEGLDTLQKGNYFIRLDGKIYVDRNKL